MHASATLDTVPKEGTMSVSRRGFLTAGGAIAVATGTHLPVSAAEASEPHVRVGKAKHFVVGKPVSFNYPDAQAPALAIRMSSAVPNGVGPDHDIIAYSQLCVHKGCPVGFNPHEEIFVCPCHWSSYDPAKDGVMIVGHATTDLPRIELVYDPATDEITAIGVHGLIYGRSSNVRGKDTVL
jgi:arsenite oxidase small subunit